MSTVRCRRCLGLILLSLFAAAAGCRVCDRGGGGTAGTSAYTVAVLPFANESGCDGAGELVAGDLAAALRRRGTYAVLGPDDLRARLAEAGLTLSPDDSTPEVLATLRQLGRIDAVIRGVVPVYRADTHPRAPSSKVFGYGVSSKFGFPLGLEDPLYAWYHKTASAAASVTVLRVADGSVLYQTPQPFLHRTSSQGRRPPTAYLPLRLEATDALVDRLVQALPPLQEQDPAPQVHRPPVP
ncbi:MAG: hypothetical protein GX591_15130 [Planctomycetes bacterium]|nr:hypothetical protein [Planctomycetota bacterium]